MAKASAHAQAVEVPLFEDNRDGPGPAQGAEGGWGVVRAYSFPFPFPSLPPLIVPLPNSSALLALTSL